MCRDYRSAYARIKEEHKVIDFDDMEHFALEILQAKGGRVADIYREKFVEIMVDEFQDSNDVQNQLVMLICRKNNVFRVGAVSYTHLDVYKRQVEYLRIPEYSPSSHRRESACLIIAFYSTCHISFYYHSS